MKSTKDNWIKAFNEKFSNTLDEDGLSIWLNCPTPEYMKSFISKVEKDAIEKTNNRWRERIGEKAEKRLWTNTVANNMHVVKKYHQGINDLVSDLLEDQHEVQL